MSAISDSDMSYCRELAMPAGSVFELTSRFLPLADCDRLLGLYALQQTIGHIPHAATDDSVKWAKLQWWSKELAEDPEHPSRHPILGVLQATGARERLSVANLQGLVRNAVLAMDVIPDTDSESMLKRMGASGACGIQLELALYEASLPEENLQFLSASTQLYSLIHRLSVADAGVLDELPLDVLAELEVNLHSLKQEQESSEYIAIAQRLSERAVGWYKTGLSDLQTATVRASHLLVRLALESRHLQAISNRPQKYLGQKKGFGPADALFVWHRLRKLRKSTKQGGS